MISFQNIGRMLLPVVVLAAGLVLGATPAGEPVESSLEAAPDVSPSA